MSSKHLALPLCLLTLLACSPSAKQPAPAEEQAPLATKTEPAAQPTQAAPTEAAKLTRVTDPSTVCMVNDQHMGNAQIPVQVDGKTYYGCCKMCESRLNSDAQVRLSHDPVNNHEVDKATAVIAKDASGKVLYFESEETLGAYLAQR